MAAILVGYDTESGCVVEASYEPMKILERSISALTDLHVRLEVPATFFIVGRTLEMGHSILRRLREHPDLFDIQQHTYSHLPLKSINPPPDLAAVGNDTRVIGGSPRQIAREVRKTSELISKYLDSECKGIRGPWGYYRGLADKPDVLGVLDECGIEFTSTYLRNRQDYFPVPLAVQPFTYGEQGFPDMMEIPSQDWIDCNWRTLYGWARTRAYSRHISGVVRSVAKRKIIWGTCFHDWSAVLLDQELSIMKTLFDDARKRGLRLMSYGGFYRQNARRSPLPPPL